MRGIVRLSPIRKGEREWGSVRCWKHLDPNENLGKLKCLETAISGNRGTSERTLPGYFESGSLVLTALVIRSERWSKNLLRTSSPVSTCLLVNAVYNKGRDVL